MAWDINNLKTNQSDNIKIKPTNEETGIPSRIAGINPGIKKDSNEETENNQNKNLAESIMELSDNIGIPFTMKENINYYKNNFTEIRITPCEVTTSFLGGDSNLKGINLKPCPLNGKGYWKDLKSFSNNYGWTNNKPTLVIYGTPESVNSDISFNNSYQDILMERFSNMSSSAMTQLNQVFNLKAEQFADSIKKQSGNITEQASGLIKKTGLETKDFNFKNSMSTAGKVFKTLINTSIRGRRMSFPRLWGGSSSSATLSFTIRLESQVSCFHHQDSIISFNEKMWMKHIGGPLASLILLGIPISEDGTSYRWPYVCRIDIPGVIKMDQAAVSNITLSPQPIGERNITQIPEWFEVNITIDPLDDNIVFAQQGEDRYKKYLNTIQKIMRTYSEPKNMKKDNSENSSPQKNFANAGGSNFNPNSPITNNDKLNDAAQRLKNPYNDAIT